MSSVEKKQKELTRRDFVKGTAVGAVGGLVVGSVGTALGGAAGMAKGGTVKVQLRKAMGHVKRDLQPCTGCRTCEAVCSLSHEGANSPSFARTWIIDYLVEGHRIEGYTCKQCNAPNCLQACPYGAISADTKSGARVINPKKCKGCKLCIEACPQYPNSPIMFDAARQIAIKCDLCGGSPLCIKYCPESALTLEKEV
jgi:carbon-monoxide dehydrogenase iron sulfur subunit